MDATPTLEVLEGRLAAMARGWDEAGLDQAAQEIADHIDTAADPEAALQGFDALVEARIDRLAESGDMEVADLYGAVVQDFYDVCGLPVLAGYLGLHRGELMIVGDHGAAAEEVIREALDVLSADDSPFYAAGAILLGQAIAMQGRHEDALPVLDEAVALGRQHDEPEIVAEASDVLGTVFHDLGRNADAARCLRRAAESWWRADNDEQASASLEAVAAAEIGLATEAARRERYDECEPHARRALEAAEGRNEVLAAGASVFLGAARLRMGAPREASELITPAVEVLRSLPDPDADVAVAVALLVLGEALAYQSNIVGADRCFREALGRAQSLGDDEIMEHALLQVIAIADQRVGLGEQLDLLGRFGANVSDPRIGSLAERNAGMRAMREGDFAEADRHFAEALARSKDVREIAEDGMSLNAMRMVACLAGGRLDEAERCLTAVDDALQTAHRLGETELVAVIPPYLEMWRGVMAMARGDHDEAARRLDMAGDQFRAAGATMRAVLVSALRGVHALHHGGAASAVGHLIPAALAAKSELVTLPSSAERAAFRSSYYMLVEPAIRAASTTGDERLMAELLEELQAQSMPLPPATGTEGRSLSALMFGLALDLSTFAPGRADANQGPRADAEQDTLLALSARIRMPWDTIALESYHNSARRYGDHVVSDRTVTLTVLR